MIDLRNIHVKIGDREYPLQIPAEEEEKVRNAAKELNERIEYYKKSIGTSDRIDLLSMVAFDSMVQFLSGKEDAKKQEQQIKLRIESLDNLIASVLQDYVIAFSTWVFTSIFFPMPEMVRWYAGHTNN